MPFPFLAAGASLLGGVAKKVAGSVLRRATKGKLLGAGGGMQILKSAGATIGTGVALAGAGRVATRMPVLQGRQGFGPDLNPFGTNNRTDAFLGFGGRKKPRRINYTNMRALRKSVRRVQGAEKMFREVFSVSQGKVTLKKRGRSCR